MSPPEHLVIGAAAANLTYGLVNLRSEKQTRYLRLALIAAIGAVLPDIDSFFGHYGSLNPKIGHRGMTHSFVGVAVLGLGLSTLFASVISVFKIFTGYYRWLVAYMEHKHGLRTKFVITKHVFSAFEKKSFCLLFLFAFIGGLTHIMADLPTPKGNWQGLPLFYPFSNARFGDLNLIGWYDIWGFWIVTYGIAVSIPLIIATRIISKEKFKKLSVVIFLILFLLNAYVFYNLIDHIKNSKYKDESSWYVYQRYTVIKKLPPKIQNFTEKSMHNFAIIYRQVRR